MVIQSASRPFARKFGSLRVRIGLGIGLLMIFLALLLAGVLSAYARHHFVSLAASNLETTGAQMARELASGMHHFGREIELHATRRVFADPASTPSEMRKALDTIKASVPEFAYLAVVDARTGVVLAASGGVAEGGSATDRPVFELAKKRLYLGDVHDAERLAELLPKAAGGKPMRFLDVGAPLRDPSGDVHRVLVSHVGWEWAEAVRKKVLGPLEAGPGIQILLVDAADRVVLAPKTSLNTGTDLKPVSQLPQPALVRWPDGAEYLTASVPTLPSGVFPGFGWRVLARQPAANVFSPLQSLQVLFVGAGLLLGLMGALGAWYLSDRLTRPISEFASAAEQLRPGETIEPSSRFAGLHEIDVVQNAFSRINENALSQAHAHRATLDAAAEVARESNERFALLLNSSAEGIYGMAPDSICTFLNQAGAEMLGYRPEELIGRPIHDVIHHHRADGTHYPVTECKIAGASRAGAKIRVDDEVFWHKDGTAVPVSYSVNPMVVAGRNAGAVITFTDVTERRRAEVALRTSEEKVRLAAQAAGLGIWTWHVAEDRVTWENDRMYEIVGLPRSDAPINSARFVSDLLYPDDAARFSAALDGARRGGKRFYFEGRFVRQSDDDLRWIEFTGLMQPPSANSAPRMLGTAADVTDRRRTEEAVRVFAAELSEADRRKTEFLATLAHELRNPLAPLRNGLHMLGMSKGSPDLMEKMRAMMERQVNHLVRLVDDLLDIARVTSGKVELRIHRAGLQEIVASAVETSLPLIESHKHELIVSLPQEALFLDVDHTRIAQVLSNLLNNAAKYTPAGGRITLSARRVDEDVVISVADTGTGIAPEALGQVFQMFTQVARNLDRSQGGLGIGLSLVRGLVELHGGTVTAESAGLGSGSTFTVRLSLAEPSHTGSGETASPDQHDGDSRSLRVLVVDDNEDAADSLATIIRLRGHSVTVSNDGVEAVRVAQEFKPQLVFLDIGMPGMTGYEVARTLRTMDVTRDAILVALTGWGSKEDRARANTAGFDHHLTKPAEIKVVQDLMSSLARAPGPAHASIFPA